MAGNQKRLILSAVVSGTLFAAFVFDVAGWFA